MKEKTRIELIDWISYACATIFVLLGLIILTAIASATYAGETYTHDFNYEILNCSILNNSNNLDGLNLTWSDSIATINTVINYQPDNFTLSCWVNQAYEVVEVHKRGGWGRPNYPNQTQQENSSVILENTNTNLSAPADNNLPPILNITSEEINKETKGFFEWLWNWFKGLFK